MTDGGTPHGVDPTPTIPSYPSLAKNNVSMEAIPLSVPTSAPALRKHHSTFALSQDRATSGQNSQSDPARPPPNPLSPQKKPQTRRRPSTANSQYDHHDSFTPSHITPMSGSGSSSPVSMRPRPLLSTGPVAEVTPWDLFPPPGSSMVTGRPEEVTPWELHPIPNSVPRRSTLLTGPAEEVTPWELFPPPTFEGSSNSLPISPKPSRRSVSRIPSPWFEANAFTLQMISGTRDRV